MYRKPRRIRRSALLSISNNIFQYLNNQYTILRQDLNPPRQSEVCYQTTALPPSHHGWVLVNNFVRHNFLRILKKVWEGRKKKHFLTLRHYCSMIIKTSDRFSCYHSRAMHYLKINIEWASFVQCACRVNI